MREDPIGGRGRRGVGIEAVTGGVDSAVVDVAYWVARVSLGDLGIGLVVEDLILAMD